MAAASTTSTITTTTTTTTKDSTAHILSLINENKTSLAWDLIADLYNTRSQSQSIVSRQINDWLICPPTSKCPNWLITCQILGLKACQKANDLRFSPDALLAYLMHLTGDDSKLNLIGKLAFSLSKLIPNPQSFQIKLASLALVNDADTEKVHLATVKALRASSVPLDKIGEWAKSMPSLARFPDIYPQTQGDWVELLLSGHDPVQVSSHCLIDCTSKQFCAGIVKLLTLHKWSIVASLLNCSLPLDVPNWPLLAEIVVKYGKQVDVSQANEQFVAEFESLCSIFETKLQPTNASVIRLLSNAVFNLGISVRTSLLGPKRCQDLWFKSVALELKLPVQSDTYILKCEKFVNLAIANGSVDVAMSVGLSHLARSTYSKAVARGICSLLQKSTAPLTSITDTVVCQRLLQELRVTTKTNIADHLVVYALHDDNLNARALVHCNYFHVVGKLHSSYTDECLMCSDPLTSATLYFAKAVVADDVKNQLQMLTVAVNTISNSPTKDALPLIKSITTFAQLTGHHSLLVQLHSKLVKSNLDSTTRLNSCLVVSRCYLALEKLKKAKQYVSLAKHLQTQDNLDFKITEHQVNYALGKQVACPLSIDESNTKLTLRFWTLVYSTSKANHLKFYSITRIQSLFKIANRAHNSWERAGLLLQLHFTLAKIHEELGLISSATFHLNETLSLAESSRAYLPHMEVLTFQAEVSMRKQSTEAVSTILQKAQLIAQEAQCTDVRRQRLLAAMALFSQFSGQKSQEAFYFDQLSDLLEAEVASESFRKLSLDIDTTPVKSGPRVSDSGSQQRLAYHLYSQAVLQRTKSLISQNKFEEAQFLLSKCDLKTPHSTIARACVCFQTARSILAEDPIYASLEDSALSLPSLNYGGRRTSMTPIRSPAASSKHRSSNYATVHRALDNLREAHDLLSRCIKVEESFTEREYTSTASLFHDICIRLSAIAQIVSPSNVDILEWTKGLALASERAILDAQRFGLATGTNNVVSGWNDEISSMKNVPSTWVVLSFNVSPAGNLVITKFSQQQGTFTVSLPLNRHNVRDVDEPAFSFQEGLSNLREIIRASNKSASIAQTSSITTPDQRKAWWDERFNLDRRLKTLLTEMDFIWFGGFRGLLSCHIIDEVRAADFYNKMKRIFREYVFQRNPRQRTRRQAMSSVLSEINNWVFDLFLTLENPDKLPEPGMLEDLIYFLLDILQFHAEDIACDELEIDEILLKVEEALRDYYACADAKEYDHIVLVLDKACHEIPWESMPILRSKSVSRVPSLDILQTLLARQHHDLRLNKDTSVRYILNPGGDLVKTQSRFESRFLAQQNWSGLIGQEPTESQLADTLSSDCVALYIGHGGAEQYIRASRIKSSAYCAPTLLLGCSSGKVHPAGEYQSYGTPLTFCTASCPLLVAMLWDVTDKDIDQFSMSLLEKWGLLDQSEGSADESICSAVTRSRDVCTLRYLNGAAPVIYGLPLKIG